MVAGFGPSSDELISGAVISEAGTARVATVGTD